MDAIDVTPRDHDAATNAHAETINPSKKDQVQQWFSRTAMDVKDRYRLNPFKDINSCGFAVFMLLLIPIGLMLRKSDLQKGFVVALLIILICQAIIFFTEGASMVKEAMAKLSLFALSSQIVAAILFISLLGESTSSALILFCQGSLVIVVLPCMGFFNLQSLNELHHKLEKSVEKTCAFEEKLNDIMKKLSEDQRPEGAMFEEKINAIENHLKGLSKVVKLVKKNCEVEKKFEAISAVERNFCSNSTDKVIKEQCKEVKNLVEGISAVERIFEGKFNTLVELIKDQADKNEIIEDKFKSIDESLQQRGVMLKKLVARSKLRPSFNVK